jgi:hypothetical protein
MPDIFQRHHAGVSIVGFLSAKEKIESNVIDGITL